jgi:hypothetical protein
MYFRKSPLLLVNDARLQVLLLTSLWHPNPSPNDMLHFDLRCCKDQEQCTVFGYRMSLHVLWGWTFRVATKSLRRSLQIQQKGRIGIFVPILLFWPQLHSRVINLWLPCRPLWQWIPNCLRYCNPP